MALFHSPETPLNFLPEEYVGALERLKRADTGNLLPPITLRAGGSLLGKLPLYIHQGVLQESPQGAIPKLLSYPQLMFMV